MNDYSTSVPQEGHRLRVWLGSAQCALEIYGCLQG